MEPLVRHQLEQWGALLRDLAVHISAYHAALLAGGMPENAALELCFRLQDSLFRPPGQGLTQAGMP